MRRSYRKKRNYSISIGITGMDSRVGVTHLAIMLANYLVSKERCQAAVVDRSQSGSLAVLQEIYDECAQTRKDSACQCFQLHKVDYYSQATKKDIADILHMGYEYVIYDFGKNELSHSDYEILRCHMKILVGSCCEWQQEVFHSVMEQEEFMEQKKQWRFAAFLGSDAIRRGLEKRYHIKIHTIPFERDPFLLHQNHFEAFQIMLQEALECL